jgi:hypothetical protein
MHQQRKDLLTQQEGKITLALQAYTLGQFKSVRRAAAAYGVPFQRLSDRLNNTTFRLQAPPNSQKLTATEEQTIVRYILDLDSRGFAPRLCEVSDIADKLLAVRGGTPVGKNWSKRFVSRTEELKMAFNRAKDQQRVLQEDPEVIKAWFKLVRETIAQYSVAEEGCYRLRETYEAKPYPARRSGVGYCYPRHLCCWVCNSAIHHLQRACPHLCMV